MPALPIEEIGSRATIFEPKGIREGLVTTGLMWNYQVVELSGVPEQDEATLNPYGLIGYELVAVTTVAATGRLVASLTRGTLPEDDEAERT
jgi:hypothetical protein